MFKNLLARVGVGAATVDTRLAESHVAPGDLLHGEVVVNGGAVAQEIDRITLSLVTSFKHDDLYETHVLYAHTLGERIELQANESRNLPFEFRIPYSTPLSLGHQQISLRTTLDISSSVDPSDADALMVVPHPLMQRVLDTLTELGFQLYSVESSYNRRMGWDVPFIQTLEFKPYGHYRSQIEELELIFQLREGALDVWLEIDKRARGLEILFEDLDLNEQRARFQVTTADLERGDWSESLSRIIEGRTGQR
ncbi:MAG TPA: sporulation protein [Roseiflexaceae bacterium]|nr:sporulation protein [Roseiflexaceae bacterium]